MEGHFNGKKIAIMLAITGLWMEMATNANATLVINYPMTYSTPNIVGTAKGFAGDNFGKDASIVAQKLLNIVGTGITWLDTTDHNRPYNTSGLTDYAGTIAGLGTQMAIDSLTQDGVDYTRVGAGWEFAIAKYDGNNAGFVMFALNGQDALIPQISHSFWGVDQDQYRISSLAVFNLVAVPESSTVFAGGAALGLLLLGVGSKRKSQVFRIGK